MEARKLLIRKEDRVIGECEYQVSPAGWCIYHTGVSPKHEGKGIAKRLVYKVLETAEKQSVAVSATCSYAAKIIHKGA